MIRALLITAAAAAIIPSPAAAAPPTLVAVGQTQQHPTASWSLPPGVQPQVIEIATNPSRGTDGSFFTENVVVFDLLTSGQTTYLSSDRRLRTGITYYVHLSGFDEPCFFADACPIREWSNILTLFIPNAPPELRTGQFRAFRFSRTGSATLEVCDEEGEFRVFITQARVRRGRVVARASSIATATLLFGPCGSLSFEWAIPRKLIRVGDIYRVTFTVVDSGSAASGALTGQSRWR